MKRITEFLVITISALALLSAGASMAAPPAGKGKNRTLAIEAYDDGSMVCAGDTIDIPPAGTIDLATAGPQCYSYHFDIPESNAFDGYVAFDEVTSDFNLAPENEDAADGDTNEICDDGNCDGVASTDPTDCTVATYRPDSATKDKDADGIKDNPNAAIPPKQPEFITVQISENAGCRITVYVKTDGNPGSFQIATGDCDDPIASDIAAADCNGTWAETTAEYYTRFEPTKCTPLRDDTNVVAASDPLANVIVDSGGIPFVDYVTVNLGVKVFRDDRSMILTAGKNTSGTNANRGSVQLSPNDCDVDGDGTLDVDDNMPLDPDIQ